MGNITRDKLIFWRDRPITGDESGTIEVTHDNLTHGATYHYALDSYDQYGNRSTFSAIQTIIAGDTTPPGTITNTGSLGGFRSIEFYWTNPTDPDFNKVKIYNNSLCLPAHLIDQIGGLKPGEKTTKTYLTAGDSETMHIYVRTLDINNNESAVSTYISGTSEADPTGTGEDNPDYTVALSVYDGEGYEWGQDILLSSARNPYRIKAQASTPLQNMVTFIYDSEGEKQLTGSQFSILYSTPGYYMYKSHVAWNVLASWADGKGYLYFACEDQTDNVEALFSLPVFIDNTKPTITSLDIDKGATLTNDRAVDISLDYGADPSGIIGYFLSTVSSNTDTAWIGVSFEDTAAGVIETSYALPNVEKTYTIYGWIKDRAGNVSDMYTSDNNTEFQKLVDTPTGAIEIYDIGGTTAIDPNENGWFNQDVIIRYTASVKRPGMVISSVLWRENINGAGWSSWTTLNPGTNPAVINVSYTTDDGIISFEAFAKNSNGEYGGNAGITIRIDTTAPTMNKSAFWDTNRSRSLNREGVLYWNRSAGSDSGVNPSGLYKTHIYRSSTISWANAHTVGSFLDEVEWMVDDDDTVQPGHTYYYWGRFEDGANNISDTSNELSVEATYDWEYEYRNFVSNGSIERTYTSNSQLRGQDWIYTAYTGAAISFDEDTAIAISTDGYHGTHCLKINNPGGTDGWGQGVFVPAGQDRVFTLSFYKKKGPIWNGNGRVAIRYHDTKGGDLGWSTWINIPPVSSWTRQTINFGKGLGVPSTIPGAAARAYICFSTQGSDTMYLDGIQWEDGNTATEFRDNQVDNAERLNVGVIDANHIRSESITAAKIDAGAVVADKVAAGAITSTKIGNDQVLQTHVGPGAITVTEIANGAVSETKIQGGAITTDKLDANAVTAAKIAGNTITASEIDANAVTASELAANAVEAGHITAGSIDSTKIVTEGLHIKSGGMSILTVGASSNPINQEYTVMTPSEMYYHPRGYSASEHWHFVKHYEAYNMLLPGVSYNFERPFKGPDGKAITPDYSVTKDTEQFKWDTAEGSNMWFSYAFMSMDSVQFTPHFVQYEAGWDVHYQYLNDIRFSQSISKGTFQIKSFPGGYSTALLPFIVIYYTIPWSGTEGQLKRANVSVQCQNGPTWTLMQRYYHAYTGVGNVNYRRIAYHADVQGASAVGLGYGSDSYSDNGPASITWTGYDYNPRRGAGETVHVDDHGDVIGYTGFVSCQFWDGFLMT